MTSCCWVSFDPERTGRGARLSFATSSTTGSLPLPDTTLVDRAILMASELVTNAGAVVHARTDLRLRLELRGDWLYIARDGSPRLLRLVTARDPKAEGGAAWVGGAAQPRLGGQPHPHGGKVVWCTLKLWCPCTRIRAARN